MRKNSLIIYILIVCIIAGMIFFFVLSKFDIFYESAENKMNKKKGDTYKIYKNIFEDNSMYIIKITNEPYIILYKNIDIVIPNGMAIKKILGLCFLRKRTLGVSIASPKMDSPGFIRWHKGGVIFLLHEKQYTINFFNDEALR
jgi:hypothetical protein